MDLTLASIPELVGELANRHQAMIFTAVNLDDDVCLFLDGSSLLCSGLATHVQHEIVRASLLGERDSNP